MEAQLKPTQAEESATAVVGQYRSIDGETGARPNHHWVPVYGIREWRHGPQVLVNSIGGRAWINVPWRDIRRNGSLTT